MTEAEAVELVCQRWLDVWATLSGGVASALPNEPIVAVDEYACVTWSPGSGRNQITQGQNVRVETRGLVLVKLWAVAGSGASRLATLSGYAKQVFDRQRLGSGSVEPLTFLVGEPGTPWTEGRWTMQVISFRWRFYETQT